MKCLTGTVGGQSFVYGKLNDKEPVKLLALVYMGEFLHRIPPKTLKTWKWSMQQLIIKTERVHHPLDERVKLIIEC
jgi:hypothetical protein